MRIAFLTPEYVTEPLYYGGLANYLFRVARGLTNLGHEVEVFTQSDIDEDIWHKDILVHRVRIKTCHLSRVLNRLSRYRFCESIELVLLSRSLKRRFLKRHSEAEFDIVQASSYHATGLVFTLNRPVPVVTRVSSYEPLWRKYYKKRLSADQQLVEWLEMASMRRSDAVYGPSTLLSDALRKNEEMNVEVIHPPFDIETCRLDTSVYKKELKGRKYLLFFGSIGLLKGCEVLAQSLARTLPKFPDMLFVFAGKIHWGPKNLTMLEHIMKKAGPCGSQIIHLGILPHEQLYPVISNSHAVVLPSLVDNTPNTMLEAMAFGKVVIGTMGASFEEFIVDRRSGILVAPGDSSGLSAAMEAVWQMDDIERQKMGAAARKRIRMLASDLMCRKLEDYFRNVIESRQEVYSRSSGAKRSFPLVNFLSKKTGCKVYGPKHDFK